MIARTPDTLTWIAREALPLCRSSIMADTHERTSPVSEEEASVSPAQRRRLKKKKIKPTQTFAEVDTDEEASMQEPRLSGALRGLNPSNMLQITPTSIEGNTRAETATPDASHYVTRASRNGRAQVNYSAKYHPMDDTLRPKRAARVTGSRSLSASVSRGRGHADDETSDDSEPELMSDNESDLTQSEGEELAARKPDPRATRHSNRAEAQKSVNYSKSHHPQDYALPGFQHRAKRGKRKSVSSTSRGKTDTPEKGIVISGDEASSDSSEEDGADQTGGQETTRTSSPPRKRLKSLGRSQITTGGRANPSLHRAESTNSEMEAILQGRHFARLEDNDAGSSLILDATAASQSMKDINALMRGIIGDGSSAEEDLDPGAAESKHERETPTDEAPRVPLGAITANSLIPTNAPVLPTPLAVYRPYFTQPQPPVQRTRMPETENSLEEEAHACERTDKGADDEHRLKQAMRESSIEAARYANAREAARRLPTQSPERGSADPTGNASRQSSNRTTSNDNQEQSSFFEDALSNYQQDLQNGDEDSPSHSDSDLPGPSVASESSGLPVSQQGMQNEGADDLSNSNSDLPDPSVASVCSGLRDSQREHAIDPSSDSAILQATENSTGTLSVDELESAGSVHAGQTLNTVSSKRKQTKQTPATEHTESPTKISSEMLSVTEQSNDE
ncbi:hypothetical protein Q7P37_006703 [Cladosporium fusiforme]